MKIYKNILVALLASIVFVSCDEASMLERGDGYLSVSLEQDSSLQTKAQSYADGDRIFSLNIYDSRGQSVATVNDYRNLETEPLVLAAGSYKVVAFSGDEQKAAWETPFYRGESTVKIYPDKLNNANVVCTIANVAVSVAFADDFVSNVKEYSVTVSNGEESLTFNSQDGTLDKTAYFSVTGKLDWKLTFKNNEGADYTSEGSYSDVKERQHYKLKFTLKHQDVEEGGAAGFKVIVDDSINPAKEFAANLYFGLSDYPSIIANEGFDISSVVDVRAGDESPKILTAIAASGISKLQILSYDLVEASSLEISELNTKGIVTSSVAYGATSATIDITQYVALLSMGTHNLEVAVYDIKGHKTEADIAFNVLSGVDAEAYSVEPGATSAVITARWFAETQPAGLGLEYREVGASDWTTVAASDITFNNSGKRFSATLIGLKTGTRYEFRPYSDETRNLTPMQFSTMNSVETISIQPWAKFAVVTGKWYDSSRPSEVYFEYREYGTTGWIRTSESMMEYDNSSRTFINEIRGLDPNTTYELRAGSSDIDAESMSVKTFTTENAGTVYNLSFDDWYQDGKVWYPFAEGGQHVWDSANEGAATFIGSSTTPETSDVVSGKAVRMESKNAVIAFAAGNLYTGDFGKISGVGAILDWGVPFDSRPLALKGHYKYSPAEINKTGSGMSDYKGQMDKMQIQVFITDWTAPFTVNTKEGVFVDFDADYIIAYGKLESDEALSSYKEFTIPLEYRSLTKKPTYIVISACASYLGDYFTGGEGSTLYVDEFSLEYSPENLTEGERASVNYR